MIIDNIKIKNFVASEFSENPIKYAHPQLIINLDRLRDFIGCAISPSPVQGALARFDDKAKTSQHYAKYRLSTAIDVFIDCDSFESYIKILKSSLFNRIGIYFDTFFKGEPHVMFHLDLKDQDLLWYRDKFGYTYSSQKDFYYKLMCKFNQEVINNL